MHPGIDNADGNALLCDPIPNPFAMLRDTFLVATLALLASCGQTPAPTGAGTTPAPEEGMAPVFTAQDCPAPLPEHERTVLEYRMTTQERMLAGALDTCRKAAWEKKIAEQAAAIETVGKETMGSACWARYQELTARVTAPWEE